MASTGCSNCAFPLSSQVTHPPVPSATLRRELYDLLLYIQFSHLRTQFWNLRIQFSHLRIQFWNLRIQFSHLRIQFWNLRIQFSHLRIQFWNLRIQFSHLRIQFWSQNTILTSQNCYDSNISPIYHGHPVGLWMMAVAFVHFRTPHAQLSQVFLRFPFCYNSNISLIYRGCPVDSGCPTPCDGHGVFSLSDNLHPIQLSVPMPFLFIMFHLSFFQIYFHSYLAYLIGDISRGTCI